MLIGKSCLTFWSFSYLTSFQDILTFCPHAIKCTWALERQVLYQSSAVSITQLAMVPTNCQEVGCVNEQSRNPWLHGTCVYWAQWPGEDSEQVGEMCSVSGGEKSRYRTSEGKQQGREVGVSGDGVLQGLRIHVEWLGRG